MLIQYCKKGVLSVLLVCGAWAGGFAQEWNLVWSEEFDRDGKWDKIECKYTEVPVSAIPEFIKKYISENYPDVKVWKIEYERKRGKYEVKLSNRWELKFDKNGTLLDIDKD